MRTRHIDVGSGPWAGDPGEWDGYRFGSESCPTLLPSAGQLQDAARGLPHDRCALVTPMLGPGDLDGAMRAAVAALDAGWCEVVVNDWGLLDGLYRLGADRLSAGRLLMRFRRGPGSTDPWEDLDDEARRYFAWGPLYDGPFLEFLRQKGVGRVEADPPRHRLPVPPSGGLAISLHALNRLVSLVASCPWLYDPAADSWSNPMECYGPCRTRGDMVLHAAALARALHLRGRAILEVIDEPWTEEELPPWVDRLIIDGPPSGTIHAQSGTRHA